ncbi:hypothetical protein PJI16_12000 [Nitrospira sp. MA-1]|nr:hypothetical protein [Nitrospira sp. MA-1]
MPDPITLIVEVLVAGAKLVGEEVVSQAVIDAWNGLKKLIGSKYESNPNVGASLQILGTKPDSTDIQEAVEKALREAGVDYDEEIRAKTNELRIRLEQENLMPRIVYQAKVEGSGSVAQGKGAIAAGAGGIAVGGNVHGNVTTGEKSGQS